MKIETSTDQRHEIALTAPEGAPFQVATATHTVMSPQIIVTVVAGPDGNVHKMQTEYVAVGAVVKVDGTLSKVKRTVRGHNLNRLDPEIREAVLATVESLGVRGTREDFDSLLAKSKPATAKRSEQG